MTHRWAVTLLYSLGVSFQGCDKLLVCDIPGNYSVRLCGAVYIPVHSELAEIQRKT